MKNMNKKSIYGIHVLFDDDVYEQLRELKKELHITYKDLFTELILEKINNRKSNRILDGQLSFDDYLKEQKLSDRVIGFEE